MGLTLDFLRMIFNAVCYQQNPFKHMSHLPAPHLQKSFLYLQTVKLLPASLSPLNTSCMVMSTNSWKILHSNKASMKQAEQRFHSVKELLHEFSRLAIEQGWGEVWKKCKGSAQIARKLRDQRGTSYQRKAQILKYFCWTAWTNSSNFLRPIPCIQMICQMLFWSFASSFHL